jgi:hypothetical protein
MTTIPKLLSMFAVLSIFFFGVAAVGAQDATVQPRVDRSGPLRSVINIVADETGLEPRDIVVQLRDGLTLSDIITTNGGDVDQVIADSLVQLTDQINQAVANGRLTQDRADKLLTNLEDVITRAINGELFPNRLGLLENRVGRGVLNLAAEQTGLERAEIVQELKAGKSLADILTEHNVDVTAFIDTAVNQASERAYSAVANGRITQERADQLISIFRDRLTESMNQSGEATA